MTRHQARFSPQTADLDAGVTVLAVDYTDYATTIDSRELPPSVASPTEPAVSHALADMGYRPKNADILGTWQPLGIAEYILDLD